MRRKPVNPDSAQAEGVDYLLREFKALRTTAPATTGIGAQSVAGVLDPTVTVAASNANPANYAAADYKCDGTADDEEINAALVYVESLGGGLVQLTEGDFYFANPLSPGLASNARGIRGLGSSGVTVLHSDGTPASDKKLISGQRLDYIGYLSISITHDHYSYAIGTGGLVEYVEAEISGADGAAAFWISSGTIRGCVVGSNHNGDGIRIRGSHLIVDGNWIKSCTGDGIAGYQYLSPYPIVVNNHVQGAVRYAIFFSDIDPICIGNNCEGDTIAFTSLAVNARYGGNNAVYIDSNTSSVLMDNDVIVAGDVSPLTTKGDLWGYDTADNRIGIGTDDYALFADSSQTLGVKWAGPGATVTATNPTSPWQGQIMFNTTDDTVKVYAGSSWYTLATDGSPTINTTALAVSASFPTVVAAAT